MLVRDWMSTDVVAIDVDDSMQQAARIMKEKSIRMLPVMKEGRLAGVVSDTDLKRASASDATSLDIHELLYLIARIKVKDIMTKNPVTVPPDFTIEETAEIFMTKNISGVPVLDEKKGVVGIITRNDLFKVLVSLSGLGKRGIQLAFQIEDKPGSIKDLTDIVRRYGARIASILGAYDRAPEGFRIIYIRIYDVDRKTLPQLLDELKNNALMLYMVDHRENRREIYRDLPK